MHPQKLLLVEDTAVNRELAQIVLEDEGYTVIAVNNGIEALEALAEQRFDLVFMDVQMPRMDGLTATAIIRQCEQGTPVEGVDCPPTLTARIRKKLAGGRLPVLAMTAHMTSGDYEHCLAAGMDGCITKPFQSEDLLSILEKQLEPTDGAIAVKNADNPAAPPATMAAAREHLQNTYHLSPEKIETLLETSHPQLAERLTAAEQGLRNNNHDEVVMAAHGLVGILANLGFDHWSKRAKKIEQTAKNNPDQKWLREQLANLRTGLAALL